MLGYTTPAMTGARRVTPVPAAARRAQVDQMVRVRKGESRDQALLRSDLARMMREPRS